MPGPSVWTGCSGSFLANRIWQRGWGVAYKIRLRNGCGFRPGCGVLPHRLHLKKIGCCVVSCPELWGARDTAQEPSRNQILLATVRVNRESDPLPQGLHVRPQPQPTQRRPRDTKRSRTQLPDPQELWGFKPLHLGVSWGLYTIFAHFHPSVFSNPPSHFLLLALSLSVPFPTPAFFFLFWGGTI